MEFNLSDEERQWALAIKETLTKEHPDLALNVTDLEYAHHAIVAKNKVSKAIKRIQRLQKFRRDNGIPTNPDDLDPHTAMQAIQKFENICGGMFLSFDREDDDDDDKGRTVSVWSYNTFVPAKFVTKEDWKACYAAFYYLFDAMHPDIAAIRAGIVAIFECENAGWRNFSYHLEKHAAHLCQDAYPIRIRSLLVLHAPTIFAVMYKLIQPCLSNKLREAVDLSANTKQAQETFCKKLLPVSHGGTQTKYDMEQAMFEALQQRYENMATFTLEEEEQQTATSPVTVHITQQQQRHHQHHRG